MFRQLASLLVLSLALPSLALARDPAVAEQRAQTRDARHYAHDVDHLVSKWDRLAAKGKTDRLAEVDLELHAVTVQELSRLRDLGVKTIPAPPPYPDQPTKVLPPEHPKMEHLRDDLVELRDLVAKPASSAKRLDRTGELLDHLSASVDARRDRAEKRLDAVKAES